jgi:hypothetical protein
MSPTASVVTRYEIPPYENLCTHSTSGDRRGCGQSPEYCHQQAAGQAHAAPPLHEKQADTHDQKAESQPQEPPGKRRREYSYGQHEQKADQHKGQQYRVQQPGNAGLLVVASSLIRFLRVL